MQAPFDPMILLLGINPREMVIEVCKTVCVQG